MNKIPYVLYQSTVQLRPSPCLEWSVLTGIGMVCSVQEVWCNPKLQYSLQYVSLSVPLMTQYTLCRTQPWSCWSLPPLITQYTLCRTQPWSCWSLPSLITQYTLCRTEPWSCWSLPPLSRDKTVTKVVPSFS